MDSESTGGSRVMLRQNQLGSLTTLTQGYHSSFISKKCLGEVCRSPFTGTYSAVATSKEAQGQSPLVKNAVRFEGPQVKGEQVMKIAPNPNPEEGPKKSLFATMF